MPTLTRNTANGDLYAFWISTTEQIVGKKYDGSWTTISSIDASTRQKHYLTSPYEVSGTSTLILMYGQGTSTPWEVKAERVAFGIPEFEEVALVAIPTLALLIILRRRRHRSPRYSAG